MRSSGWDPAPGPPAFADRVEAGRRLGALVAERQVPPGTLVLGLPRGGVPVAAGVAAAVGGVLDCLVVRKLGVPGHEELAFGALASGGVRVLDERVLEQTGLSETVVEAVTRRERAELDRREAAYRSGRAALRLAGRPVVLVDDGLATGSSMRAALSAVRAAGAAPVTVAVPVGLPEVCGRLASLADDVVCAVTPRRLGAVGAWYRDFRETTDEEVRMVRAGGPRDAHPPDGAGRATDLT